MRPPHESTAPTKNLSGAPSKIEEAAPFINLLRKIFRTILRMQFALKQTLYFTKTL
jgi:hypothetical protein